MKKSKAQDEKVGYFIDRNNRLMSTSDKFIYETLIYQITRKSAELYESKIKEIKEFKGFDDTEMYEKNGIQYMKCIDLISAPEDFLIKLNFKPVS